MQKVFFTPGPSQLYPTVKKHIEQELKENISSISHRSKEFEEIFSKTLSNLRKLMDIPQNYHLFFLSSGTEAMERIIENCVEKESMHFVNGSFSKRFFDTSVELKKTPIKVESELGEGFSFKDIKIAKTTELVCFTHNETSTGVMLPLNQIYKLKKLHPESLFCLDVVSSAPYPRLNFEFLDCVFFSVQKCFGLPSGLGVIIVSPKALEKSKILLKENQNIGSYHSFPYLEYYAGKNQTPETPSVFHIYLLNKIVEDFLSKGINTIRKEIDEKAKLVYDFLESHKTWSAFVKDNQLRSKTVIVVQIGENSQKVINYLGEKGMIVGNGYGKNKDSQLRIANFPAISLKDIKKLLIILRYYTI